QTPSRPGSPWADREAIPLVQAWFLLGRRGDRPPGAGLVPPGPTGRPSPWCRPGSSWADGETVPLVQAWFPLGRRGDRPPGAGLEHHL
ncbi:hypothetical protein NHX12_009884, partial [Muraenolepis orangiensis]